MYHISTVLPQSNLAVSLAANVAVFSVGGLGKFELAGGDGGGFTLFPAESGGDGGGLNLFPAELEALPLLLPLLPPPLGSPRE